MTSSKTRILELARSRNGVRPHDLARELGVSNVAIHKHLRELIQRGLIAKRGRAPMVLYVLVTPSATSPQLSLPTMLHDQIESEFCYMTPLGEQLNGVTGFWEFLERTDQMHNPLARAGEFGQILSTASQFVDSDGVIDGTKKVSATFANCSLTKVYYSAFYSLPKYGKTKLGQLLLHGKSGQIQRLIQQIATQTKAHVDLIIRRHKIEAIAYAPHSIPRKIPFLKEYRSLLGLALPEIPLIKAYSGEIPIAQKSLNKLSERIENARQSIFVANSSFKFNRILIIDDALGSGATMNEIAAKLQGEGRQIFGYAIVGSYKGFEVIKEV